MSKQPSKPAAPPPGLTGSGLSLWKSTVAEFELGDGELALLREACKTAVLVDELQAVVDREGVLNTSPHGVRAHPALVELRQQRLCFARLVKQLAIPADDQPAAPGRRAKGSYGIKGVVK